MPRGLSPAGLVLLGVAASWGFGFVATATALTWVPPLLFLGIRFLLAFCVMSAIFWRRFAGTGRQELVAGSVTGTFLALAFILQTFCMKHCSVPTAAFLTALYVVLVPLLNSAVLRKPVRPLHAVAAVVSFTGTAVASLGTAGSLTPGDFLAELWPGEFLGLGCALGFALRILAVARWAPRTDTARFSTIQVGVASLMCLVPGLLLETVPRGCPRAPVLSLLYLSLVNTAGAFFAQNWAQKHTTATQAAVIMSSEPVWAALFAFLALGQKLRVAEVLGDIMILTGVVLAQEPFGKPERRVPAVSAGAQAANQGRGDQ